MDTDEHGHFTHQPVTIDGTAIQVVIAGDPAGKPVLFLHGWPQSWYTWQPVLERAGTSIRGIALDLPGIGLSVRAVTDGTKRVLADVIHQVAHQLELDRFVLVGHDIGGMVVYAYLRTFADVERAVIMDVVIPGIHPWDEVLRNPYLWHFALHAIPQLPELLVEGRQGPYFDYFYSAIAAEPSMIPAARRARYLEAYRSDVGLRTGFDWYRAFPADAEANRSTYGRSLDTPVLYLRGEHESGNIDDYVNGLREAGLTNLAHVTIPGAGHFTQEEAPAETWQAIARFIGLDDRATRSGRAAEEPVA